MVATTFRDFLSAFRHYFRFSKEEIMACIISVFALAFIVSFKEWGYGDKFEFYTGIYNLFKAVIIVSIVLGLQIIITKIQALNWGFRAEFKIWWYGILVGIMLAFLTKGSFWFLASGGIFFHHLATHRLGWFRYGVNMMETAVCCMLGSLSSLVVAIFFKILLYISPGSLFFEKGVIVAAFLALYSMIPLPPLNGSRMFFWSRLNYSLVMGSIIGFNFMIRTSLGIIPIILISFLIGVIIWILWSWRVEAERK